MRLIRFLKYQYYKLIRLKDAPARVAQGVGLGFAMDFAVPVPLLSIFVAFVTARILKINSLAAVIAATALKPLFPGIITLNLYVRSLLISLFPRLADLYIPKIEGTTFLERAIDSIFSKGIPYLIACEINAIIIFFAGYFIVFYLLQMRLNRLNKNKQ